MDHFTSCLLHIRGRLGYEGLDPTWLTRWDKPHALWKFLLPQELHQWQRSPWVSFLGIWHLLRILHLALLCVFGSRNHCLWLHSAIVVLASFCADPEQVLCIVLAIIACAADPRLALGTLDCWPCAGPASGIRSKIFAGCFIYFKDTLVNNISVFLAELYVFQ